MLGDILAQMCAPNQAVAYPPSLHISKATNILMVPNRCFPRLPLKYEGRKKGFEM